MTQEYKTLQELFADPIRWTKGAYAKDAGGRGLNTHDGEGACCWCTLGGIRKVYGKGSPEEEQIKERIAKRVAKDVKNAGIIANGAGSTVLRWNDYVTTHEQLLDVLTELKV